MECYYDTLFEVKCIGIDELRKVQCLYLYNVSNWSRTQWGLVYLTSSNADPSYWKRLNWILKCANASMGGLHHFDDLKTNKSTYFVKIEQIFVPVRFVWGWGLQSKDLQFPQCYYIGTYPNYWDFKNGIIVYPHNLPVTDFAQMGSKPRMFDMNALAKSADLWKTMGIYGQPVDEFVPSTRASEIKEITNKYGKESLTYYFNPEKIPPEFTKEQREQIERTNKAIEDDLMHITIFHKPKQLGAYFGQHFALEERTYRYNMCVKKVYPKPTYVPKSKIQTPTGPQTYTPEPTLKLPYPDMAERPGIAPPWGILNLLLNFIEEPGAIEPTLSAKMEFYWI